jgi:hypothetical protein
MYCPFHSNGLCQKKIVLGQHKTQNTKQNQKKKKIQKIHRLLHARFGIPVARNCFHFSFCTFVFLLRFKLFVHKARAYLNATDNKYSTSQKKWCAFETISRMQFLLSLHHVTGTSSLGAYANARKTAWRSVTEYVLEKQS